MVLVREESIFIPEVHFAAVDAADGPSRLINDILRLRVTHELVFLFLIKVSQSGVTYVQVVESFLKDLLQKHI